MPTRNQSKTRQMPHRAAGAIRAAESRNRRNAFARGDIAGFFEKHGVPPKLADEVVDQLSEHSLRRLAQTCRPSFQKRTTAAELSSQAERADISERTRSAFALLPEYAAAELAGLLAVVTWSDDIETET